MPETPTPRTEATMDGANAQDLQDRMIADCPTPIYHETHRYCPSCPWTEDYGKPTNRYQVPLLLNVDAGDADQARRLVGDAVKRWSGCIGELRPIDEAREAAGAQEVAETIHGMHVAWLDAAEVRGELRGGVALGKPCDDCVALARLISEESAVPDAH